MARGMLHSPAAERIAEAQHDVVTRAQLLAVGLSAEAIRHRIASGRLYQKGRGIYAVGRPRLTGHGEWMVAILGCGPRAVLSHASAAALWGIRPRQQGPIEVSVGARSNPRRPGVVARRRSLREQDITMVDGIPVTRPDLTLVDLATILRGDPLEAAVNEADKLGLIDPEALRVALEQLRGRRGWASCAASSTAARSLSPTRNSSAASFRSPDGPAFPGLRPAAG